MVANRSWSSGLTFILAAVGAAVGLGNIWKFPYVAGVSGGGAFVLVYLLCVVVVAIPILIAELLIGRCGKGSPPVAMRRVAEASGRSPAWSIVGIVGMLVGYLIATYYSVIAGWTLVYIYKAGTGFGGAGAGEVAAQFDELLADPVTMTIWHTVFMCIALLIVGRGLRRGIERVVKLLMPALFVMLVVMIGVLLAGVIWFVQSTQPPGADEAYDRIKATEQLQAVVGNLALHFGRGVFQHGRVLRAEVALGVSVGAFFIVRAVDGYFGFHLGQFEAGVLEAGNGGAESLALQHVIDSDVHGSLGGGDRLGGDAEALPGQFLHHDDETFVQLAQEGVLG